MTGFGNVQVESEEYRATIEVKALNSKFFDLQIRLPRQFSDKELDIRNLVSRELKRGKVSLVAEFETLGKSDPKIEFNTHLFKKYYQSLKALADTVGHQYQDLFKIALQQPDVINNFNDSQASENHWIIFKELCADAVRKCDSFRIDEGSNLIHTLLDSIKIIGRLKIEIASLDSARIESIRNRININLVEFIGKDKIDENRFEQELIYFIEKLDISEELVRLDSHIDYFKDVVVEEESNGKKLGFISQELGREINTIGSKSNDAAIQRLVVQMKDELEKIKEQTLNIL